MKHLAFLMLFLLMSCAKTETIMKYEVDFAVAQRRAEDCVKYIPGFSSLDSTTKAYYIRDCEKAAIASSKYQVKYIVWKKHGVIVKQKRVY